MENNTLNHWGIKGMRWGIRRFQNKDGSLTAAGKKRRQQQDNDESEKAKPATPKKKSVSEMTDDELNKAIARARLEDQYKALRPEQEPAVKKFVSATMKQVIGPAVSSAGKDFLETYLKKMGADVLKDTVEEDPNSISALTKARDKLKLKKEIDDLKNPKKDSDNVNWDNRLKKQQWEANDRKAKKEAADAAKEAADKASKEAGYKQQVEDYFYTQEATKQAAEQAARERSAGRYSSKGASESKSFVAGLLGDGSSTSKTNTAGLLESGEDFVTKLFKEIDDDFE